MDAIPAAAVETPSIAAPVQAMRGVLHAFHDPCVLGTRLNLIVRADAPAAAYDAACRVRREIARLDGVFNWRDPASEIAQLNRSDAFPASDELFAVVTAAERWRVLSGGAFSGRLGRLGEARRAMAGAPDEVALNHLAGLIARADVRLDERTRTIMRPDAVKFDLDAIAKGYIIDQAVAAAMTDGAGVSGVMADIGGDIRCAGEGPQDGRWRIALPEPLSVFDNAPACGAFDMGAGAIATSGFGAMHATLDAREGRLIARQRSATAVAATAMEADALATAMLAGGEAGARAMLDQMPGASGRVTQPGGVDWMRGAGEPLATWIRYDAPQEDYRSGWPDGWIASLTFSAPPKDMRRSIAFRSPYVAIWVSDAERRTVRTLLLIGTVKEWQEFNHIWWRQNRGATEKLLNGRSMSTRGSGLYKIFWDGIDDDGRPVKPGRFTLHVETSRERGEHTHRTLEVDFSTMRPFTAEMPMDPNAGGLSVSLQKF